MSARAERLYERALARPPEARAAFVEEVCRGDSELRDELLSLLEHAEAAEEFFGRLSDEVLSGSFVGGPETEHGDVPGGEAAPGMEGPRASRELPPGHRVGRYRILERVGRGGMGTVYRARDTELGRDVALKFLPPELRADEEAEERLLIEARAAAALQHPNVCTVHEIGETEDGQPFIAMAFYEGETLKDRLRRGPLGLDEATRVAEAIVRGLGAAHTHQVMHRDVKPGNVMLCPDGTVKLLDFGLAKMADVTVTRPGARLGTIAYMSPERVRGDPVDPRTDLWSVGVVFYEMLTGVRPFRGGNDRALLQAILHDDPEPIATRRPETPEPLVRIVERLLQKAPDARYASAAELRADLKRVPTPAGGVSRATGAPRRRRGLALIGVAAVLVAALMAGTHWLLGGRGEESVPVVPTEAAERASIAVLPLADRSAAGRDAALAKGMTEELIAILARAGGLRVIASTSVFAFEGSRMDVRRIADSLGVAYLVEGSLRKLADRIRVQVRLVDARDGSTRWSQTYDRAFEDVFAVQEEIARSVARELDPRLAGTESKLLRHQRPNIAAYELYLRGSDEVLLRSDSGQRRAAEYFERAIEVDSTYAAAYAGLARMYVVLKPGKPAERAALRAVALDDSLAEAHAALAIVRWLNSYDFAAAETELKRAIELDPTDPRLHRWLAQLYMQTGRPRAALAPARRALEIDPLSPAAHAEMAHALLANGRYDEALARLQPLEELQPPLGRAAPYTAQAYALKRMWPEAIAVLRRQAEHDGSWTLSLYGYLLARGGRRDEAHRIRTTLLERWRRGSAPAFDVAVVHAGLGDLDRAFAWLERSIEDRSLFRPNYHVMEPIFDDLRSDPRFERIREELGLQRR